MNARAKLPGRSLIVCVALFTILGPLTGRTVRATPAGRPALSVATRPASLHCARRNRATGSVRFSSTFFPDSLNPFQTGLFVSGMVDDTIFDNLFRYDGKGRLFPMMATEVPTIQNGGIRDGGKTVILRLKHGLRWSNGTEITARDVAFSWRVSMDPATGPDCESRCDVISRIETPGRYTAVLHLKQPYAPLVAVGLPSEIWPHVWRGAWKDDPHAAALKLGQDRSFNFEGPSFPTSGPYHVVEFVQNNRIVLHPMRYYQDMTCGAYIKDLRFVFYSSKISLIAAAESRETDVTEGYTGTYTLSDLQGLRSYRHAFTVHVTPGYTLNYLELNQDRTYGGAPNPLANTNVRLALALALDKAGMIESALGATPKMAKSIEAWTPWVNTPKLVQPFTDRSITGQWDPIARRFVAPGTGRALTDARTLLSRTPWKGGFSLDFFSIAGVSFPQAQEAVIANNWARIGVHLVPRYLLPPILLGVLFHGGFQVAMVNWFGWPDPDLLKFNMQTKYIDRRAAKHSLINGNFSGIHDPVIDRAFDKGAHTTSDAVRYRNYRAIQRRLNQRAYWITLYFRPVIMTSDNRVRNFVINPTGSGPTWNIYAWRAAAG